MANKLNVLVENKNEYLEHLTDISNIPICKFFVNISNSCSSLKEFQNELVFLTKWTKKKQDIKMNTIHKLIEEDNATPQYMLKILSEIISKSIKIKIIEHKSTIKSIKVYIPEWYEFLYKVCVLCSNEFWKNPVLFYKKVSSIQRQNNINSIEKITKHCIKNAIRTFIPLNQIINEITPITGGEIRINNIISEESEESDQSEESEESDNELQQSDNELQQSDNELEESDTELQQSDNELQQSDTELQQSDNELEEPDN